MTYLGYQVKDLPDCSAQLEEWIQAHEVFSVWGKTVVGSGCDYGINPEEYPWGETTIKLFEVKENQCFFTTIDESYTLTACELPSDKWGNTATFSEGLHSGIEIGYFDSCYTDYEPIHSLFKDLEIELDSLECSEFIEWVEENYPKIISTVGEDLICNNTASVWAYYTTNVELSSEQWVNIAKRYASEVVGNWK